MRLSVFNADAAMLALCQRARVWLDGVEITDRCQVADDDAGVVVLLLRRADGALELDGSGDPARVERYGRVRIEVTP